jgi:hypothetical protein
VLVLGQAERRSEQDGGPKNVRDDRKEAEEIDGVERRDAELVMELGGDRGEYEQRDDAAKNTHL